MNEEKRYDLLKSELLLVQQQMDKYDQLSTTIKTWAITLWAASVGWAFQIKRGEILLLSILVLCIFWILDARNKHFRQDYKHRRDEIAKLLQHYFTTGEFQAHASSPLLPTHERRPHLKNLFIMHIALPYVLLALTALIIYQSF